MGATTLISVLSLASVVMLPGDEAPWRQKEIPQWDDQDARTLLAESPWVGSVKLEKVRNLSKFERRDGGNWEAGTPDTLGPFTPDGLLKLASIFDAQTSALAREWSSASSPIWAAFRCVGKAPRPCVRRRGRPARRTPPTGTAITTPLPSTT